MALTISDVKKVFIPKNTRVTRNNAVEADQGLTMYNDAISLYDAIQLVAVGSSGSNTNLGVGTIGTSTVQLTSSTGSPTTPPASTPLTAGWHSAADKTKSDLITITQPVNLDSIEQATDSLVTLSGTAANSTSLGAFSGATIPDNSTIKQALQALETGLSNTTGNAENGISGNGSALMKYVLGGALTQNTTIDGLYNRTFTINKLSLATLEANNNVVGNAKSSLQLTTLLTAGASLRSEVNGTSTRYAEVRVDPDGNLTALQAANGSNLKAGVYIPSDQETFLQSYTSGTSRTFKVNSSGHFAEGISTGTTAKTLYIDDVTGQLFKGDTPSGSSVAAIHSYDAGNGAIVKATGTGITFTKAAGVGTFTAPIGVTLLSARINGVTADLAGDSSFSIVCPTTSLDDFPNVTKINRVTGATPTGTVPYQYDLDNAPMIQITDSTSTSVKVRVINLNTYSYWALKLNF